MLRRLGTLPWLPLAFGLAACGGNSPENQLGPGSGNTDADTLCEETHTPVDVQEQVGAGLGFSAADVLSFSAKEHQSVLRWLPVQQVSYGPESGEVAMSLSVRYAGGPIELVESMPRSSGDTILDIGPARDGCVNALVIEVQVELTTAEGALAEQFTAALRAHSALSAEIVQAVELDSLDGEFEVTVTEGTGTSSGNAELLQPKLRIMFSEVGTEGRFEALFEERSGGDSGFVTGSLVEFACWPADQPCGP